MPQYQMPGASLPAFRALDTFTQGYIEAMFWTEEDNLREQAEEEGTHLEGWGDVDFADLAPESLAQIVAECEAFQAANAFKLQAGYARGYAQEQAGHDFWLTRNRHGAGYWGREELEPKPEEAHLGHVGEQLSDSARACGERTAYLGTDGLVYVERG